MKHMIKIIGNFLFYCFLACPAFSQTAAILPPGYTTFFDANGNPLSSGKVYTYIPSTLTPKTTWQDSAEAILNTNPVTLDAAGKALIYGQGTYRTIVRDRNGNLIWDAVTASSGSGGGSTGTGDGDLVGTIKPWAGVAAPNQYAFAYGQELSRTTYSALFTAITQSLSVICTSASNTLTGIADTTQIRVGSNVESTCLPGGTTLVSKTSSTVVVSNVASISLNSTAVFLPFGNGNGSTTFNVPDLRDFVIAGRPNMGGTDRGFITSTYFGVNPNGQGAVGGAQSGSVTVAQANLPAVTLTTSIASGQGAHTHTYTSTQNTATSSAGGQGLLNQLAAQNTGSSTLPAMTGTTPLGGSGTALDINRLQPTMMMNYIIKITPDTNSTFASGVTSLGGMTGDIACGTGLLCTGNIISVSSTSLITSVTANYTVTSSDCGTTISLGGSAFYTLTVGLASGFPASCTINIINSDTGRGKRMTINGITFGNTNILWPKQTFQLTNIANTWTIVNNPDRFRLSGTTTFFVNSSLGSNLNDGLAAGAGAFGSLQGMINTICSQVDLNLQSINVTVNATTYNEQLTLCALTGVNFNTGYNVVNVDMTGSTLNGATIGIFATSNASSPFVWKNLIFTGCAVACVEADSGGLVVLDNPSFSAVAGSHVISLYTSRVIFANNGYRVTGGAGVHWQSQFQGAILIQPGKTVTCSGTPYSFIIWSQSYDNGFQNYTGTSFSGCGGVTTTLSGGTAKCDVRLGGGLETNGIAATIPGSGTCTATSPGWVN